MDKSKIKRRKRRRKPRAKFTLLFVAFWIALFGISFAFIIGQSGRYSALRAELDGIEADIARAEEHNFDLQTQLDFFDIYAYIENLARERLGMLRPNEIIFRNIAE